jgi:hypothetical protein
MRLRSLLLALVAFDAACNCGQQAVIGGTGGSHGGTGGAGNGGTGGSSTGGSGGGADGMGGMDGMGGGGDVFDPDSGCAAVTSQATLGTRPVDILMVIDNSGSMTEEITGVQANINSSFAAILNDGGLDYRVILLSKNGSATANQSICITPPLSGNATCTPPPAVPTNGPRFFQYDYEITSTNELQAIISRYAVPDANHFTDAGYREWLRPDAFKEVVIITDDNSAITPAAFEGELFALNPPAFGTDAGNRNYKLNAIIGVPYKPNPTDPYLPTDPIATGKCPTAVNSGPNYQPLSIATGGLRFPLCDPTKYDVVFQTFAQGVIAGAKVACQFTIPPTPPGFTMFNKIIVNYTPMGTGTVQSFSRAASSAACASDKFYVDGDQIILCPAVCSVVQSDMQAKIDVIFTCEPEIM